MSQSSDVQPPTMSQREAAAGEVLEVEAAGVGAGGAAAGTPEPAPASTPSPTRWWTRLERSVALLVSVSTLAAAGAALVTVRQATNEQHLTRDGQVTDRYNAAVTNLGDDAEEVRIGGLYALQRIAQDSPRDAPTIVQVISAYIRGHSPMPEKGEQPPSHPANDVDAALRILTAPLDPDTPADLHDAELHGVQLQSTNRNSSPNLSGADLTGADLSGAMLVDADLSSADLTRATLFAADLTSADLTSADLTSADLTRATLFAADLTNANLVRADLTGAKGYTPSLVPKGQKTVSPPAG